MELIVLGSSSKGNCYLLRGESETLILEAGVNISEIKMALNFNWRDVVGCVFTHNHKDHSQSIKELSAIGIRIIGSKGSLEATPHINHNTNTIKHGQELTAGNFIITAFDAKHDAEEPLMYLIHHPEMGYLLFATDTRYIPYHFKSINHFLLEANYSSAILDGKLKEGSIHPTLAKRIIKSHMSLEHAREVISASGIDKIRSIVLIHLSDSNSDAAQFKSILQVDTGIPVHIADKGLRVELRRE